MGDFRVLLFLYIVHGFLMAMTGLRLFGYRGNFKVFIGLGIIYGTTIWIVRGIYSYYNIPLGTHSIILTGFFSALTRIVGKVNWGTALGVALVGLSLAMLGGSMSVLLLQYLQLEVTEVLSNPWLHILIGHTENIFLVIMLVLNYVFGFTLTRPLEDSEQG